MGRTFDLSDLRTIMEIIWKDDSDGGSSNNSNDFIDVELNQSLDSFLSLVGSGGDVISNRSEKEECKENEGEDDGGIGKLGVIRREEEEKLRKKKRLKRMKDEEIELVERKEMVKKVERKTAMKRTNDEGQIRKDKRRKIRKGKTCRSC
jgi:hypothetical protein